MNQINGYIGITIGTKQGDRDQNPFLKKPKLADVLNNPSNFDENVVTFAHIVKECIENGFINKPIYVQNRYNGDFSPTPSVVQSYYPDPLSKNGIKIPALFFVNDNEFWCGGVYITYNDITDEINYIEI